MRTRSRNRLAALGATVALTAGLAAPGQPASANGTRCNPGCEAHVKVRTVKETMTIRDRASDGHSAVGWLQIRIGSEWLNLNRAIYWNSRGAGGRPRVVPLNLPENARIRYRACVGERALNQFFDCSRKWRYDRG